MNIFVFTFFNSFVTLNTALLPVKITSSSVVSESVPIATRSVHIRQVYTSVSKVIITVTTQVNDGPQISFDSSVSSAEISNRKDEFYTQKMTKPSTTLLRKKRKERRQSLFLNEVVGFPLEPSIQHVHEPYRFVGPCIALKPKRPLWKLLALLQIFMPYSYFLSLLIEPCTSVATTYSTATALSTRTFLSTSQTTTLTASTSVTVSVMTISTSETFVSTTTSTTTSTTFPITSLTETSTASETSITSTTTTASTFTTSTATSTSTETFFSTSTLTDTSTTLTITQSPPITSSQTMFTTITQVTTSTPGIQTTSISTTLVATSTSTSTSIFTTVSSSTSISMTITTTTSTTSATSTSTSLTTSTTTSRSSSTLSITITLTSRTTTTSSTTSITTTQTTTSQTQTSTTSTSITSIRTQSELLICTPANAGQGGGNLGCFTTSTLALARSNDALHAELFEFMPNIFEKLVEERNMLDWTEGSEEKTHWGLSLLQNSFMTAKIYKFQRALDFFFDGYLKICTSSQPRGPGLPRKYYFSNLLKMVWLSGFLF